MRTAVIDQYGGMPRIDDVVQPLPSSGQTLVAVKATALIPLDLQVPGIPGARGGCVDCVIISFSPAGLDPTSST